MQKEAEFAGEAEEAEKRWKKCVLCTKKRGVSIFTHFFLIYTHIFAKKVVILQHEIISGIAPMQ